MELTTATEVTCEGALPKHTRPTLVRTVQMRALAKRKGTVRKQPLQRGYPEMTSRSQSSLAQHGPTILKNSFPGNEFNEETPGESEGNRIFPQLSKVHREP